MAFVRSLHVVLIAVVAKFISVVVPEVVVSGGDAAMMVSGGQVEPLP